MKHRKTSAKHTPPAKAGGYVDGDKRKGLESDQPKRTPATLAGGLMKTLFGGKP